MTKKMCIELNRVGNNVSFKIKIPAELEEFFKTFSENEIATSNKWFSDEALSIPAKFYKNGEKYDEIQNRLADLGLHTYNDFGDGLVRNRAINLAPLRIIGVSGIDGTMLYSQSFDNSGIDFEFYVRELALAVKTIWKDHISKKSLKATISYEV